MTFLYMLEAMRAHGYRVEQIALREVRFRSLNGFYRLSLFLGPDGWGTR